ncbi:MAG: hypothetical protein AB9888_15605 [Bacteroidales bacterium]
MSEENWSLTPKGKEFVNGMKDEIMKMMRMDKIVEGIKNKFVSKQWILVEHNEIQVEVWSIVNQETVGILDDEMFSNSQDKAGNLFPANNNIYLYLALRMVSARDGKDHELTHDTLRLRKWLQTLPIGSDVMDGSCIDNYWDERRIKPSGK